MTFGTTDDVRRRIESGINKRNYKKTASNAGITDKGMSDGIRGKKCIVWPTTKRDYVGSVIGVRGSRMLGKLLHQSLCVKYSNHSASRSTKKSEK